MSDQPYRPGNLTDFDRLYRQSHGRIIGTLIGMLRDRAAAEDCAQEAFIQAFRAWPRWRPDAPAEAWVHRIAINTAVSHLRREKLREVGEVVRRLGRPGGGKDPADVVERNALLAALRQLPPRQAAAVVLRHLHGYSNREIAAALGVPERTVASRLAAAKTRLRVILGESWAGLGPAEMGTGGPAGVEEANVNPWE